MTTKTNVPSQASDEPMRAANGGRIPVPQNAQQAEGMMKLGLAWLQHHAPERLTEAGRAATPRATADVEQEPPVPVTILRAALKNAALGQSSYGTNYDGNKLGRAIEILIATKGAKP